MNKRNTWIGLVAIIIIVAAVIFAVAHKSDNNTTGNSTSYNSTGSSQNSTSSNTTGQSQSTSSGIVTTKTESDGTQFLAGASGAPLYTYGGDTSGTSNCTGACLVSWPIYEATSSSASLPANVTTITRSDGKVQYAYKGLPLYYFSSDSGSTPSGDGVGDFHLAKP